MVILYNIFGKAVFHCRVLVGSLKSFSNGFHVHKTSLYVFMFYSDNKTGKWRGFTCIK